MEKTHLKLVSFASKGFKKQLIVSAEQVNALESFLRGIMSCEVMIINTNVGLDVYYISAINHKIQIESAVLLLLAKEKLTLMDFITHDLDSESEIAQKVSVFFNGLLRHPLLFKSYSKSFCHQINNNYSKTPNIIEALFLICQDELLRLNNFENQVTVLRPFLANLQLAYIEQSCKPELQDLLKSALDHAHSN